MPLMLKEDFTEFRHNCSFRKYWQEYANDEYVYRARKLGEEGKDYGNIKCAHKKSKTGWCKGDACAKGCPRVLPGHGRRA